MAAQQIEEEIDSLDEFEFDNDILNLSCLLSCIKSIIGTDAVKSKRTDIAEDLVEVCARIGEAMELISSYDRAQDEDLKHEFGFQYSEIIADIGDMMEEINEKGINLYIH